MPGNILTRMFGCFGNVNHIQANTRPQAQRYAPAPPATATAPRAYAPAKASFVPGRYYSAAELQEIARQSPPGAQTKSEFLNTMAAAFNRPNTTRLEKAGLCRHIAKLIQNDNTLNFKGAPRQANFFASYSIDLNLQELDVAYNTNIERDVREMLNLWTNRLCPAQTEFNLDGVVYSRNEINEMLKSPTLIHRKTSAQNASLEPQLEDALRTSGSQNVHNPAVRTNGARVMEMMRQKHGQNTEMTNREIILFLSPAMRQHPHSDRIQSGLNHCLRHNGFDPNSPGRMTPKQLLGNVCQYIQSTNNSTMRSNLTNALLTRLDEIHTEQPCVVGVSQRLIDVPNGIDPDMNFAGRAAQIEQEVITIAGKAYNQFSDLVEEGLQAIQGIEENKNLEGDDEVITDIGQNMFNRRLKNDLSRLGGIAESEIAPHRERLKTGFTSPS